MATTPTQLATLASQYGQFDKLLAKWAMVYLLEQYTGITMTASTLATVASQYGQFDPLLSDWAIIYLLQQIVTNGSGGGGGAGGGVTFTSSGAGTSPLVAAGIAASTTALNLAADTSTNRIWFGFSGVWH
jgi:hypothetical protein